MNANRLARSVSLAVERFSPLIHMRTIHTLLTPVVILREEKMKRERNNAYFFSLPFSVFRSRSACRYGNNKVA